MAETAPTAPGTLARTRRAILDAAIKVYAADRTAPLGEVAKAAEVGRSTLHRYFPDRAALVRGLFEDCAETAHRTLREAALGHGPPAEAFRRLIVALFDLGPRVNFLFNETQLTATEWEGPLWERANMPTAELFVRGREEGFFAAEVDMEWFFRTLWYMLAAGWEAVEEGSLPRHEAIAAVTRTLEGGLLSPGPSGPSGPRP